MNRVWRSLAVAVILGSLAAPSHADSVMDSIKSALRIKQSKTEETSLDRAITGIDKGVQELESIATHNFTEELKAYEKGQSEMANQVQEYITDEIRPLKEKKWKLKFDRGQAEQNFIKGQIDKGVSAEEAIKKSTEHRMIKDLDRQIGEKTGQIEKLEAQAKNLKGNPGLKGKPPDSGILSLMGKPIVKVGKVLVDWAGVGATVTGQFASTAQSGDWKGLAVVASYEVSKKLAGDAGAAGGAALGSVAGPAGTMGGAMAGGRAAEDLFQAVVEKSANQLQTKYAYEAAMSKHGLNVSSDAKKDTAQQSKVKELVAKGDINAARALNRTTVRVRVTNAGKNAPIAGASIRISVAGATTSGSSDGSGAASITVFSADDTRARVTASAKGCVSMSREISLSTGSGSANLALDCRGELKVGLIPGSPMYVKPGERFTVSAHVTPLNAPGVTYDWQVDGKTIKRRSEQTTLAGKYDKPGRHTVRVSASNATGMTSIATLVVIVEGDPPKVAVPAAQKGASGSVTVSGSFRSSYGRISGDVRMVIDNCGRVTGSFTGGNKKERMSAVGSVSGRYQHESKSVSGTLQGTATQKTENGSLNGTLSGKFSGTLQGTTLSGRYGGTILKISDNGEWNASGKTIPIVGPCGG